jgi:hypothetical protein
LNIGEAGAADWAARVALGPDVIEAPLAQPPVPASRDNGMACKLINADVAGLQWVYMKPLDNDNRRLAARHHNCGFLKRHSPQVLVNGIYLLIRRDAWAENESQQNSTA